MNDDYRFDLRAPDALASALSAIGVAAPARPSTTIFAGSTAAAALSAIRCQVDERVAAVPVDLEAKWPANRAAVVVAPDASSLVAVVRTGAKRSTVVSPDGRRRRMPNRLLVSAHDRDRSRSGRVARTFNAMRRSADPAHTPLVITFATLEGVAGGRLRARALLAGNVALSVVATVAMVAAWGFAFTAVEAISGRATLLLLAAAAAAVAATTRAASSTLGSKVATAWSMRLRSQLAERVLAADPRQARATGELKLLVAIGEADGADAASIEAALAASGGLAGVALAGLLALATFPAVLLPVLALWIVAVLLGARRYHRANQALVRARRKTGSWVAEQLRAHETRWVQAAETDPDVAARPLADGYDTAARRADRSEWFLSFAAPGIGLAAAIGAVGILAVTTDPDTGVVAAALAAALVGYQSITAVANGLVSATRVAAARRAALDVLPESRRHARTPEPVASAELERRLTDSDSRVAVVGPTGSGKTRLLAALARDASRREPPVLVPAFGDNFMFRDSLAFNLLLGRGWPATPDELALAERAARSVGLAELLDRMPLGIHTPVGETGWQLSNGERTMVFLARALLAGDRPLLLDDGLDAIDAGRRALVAEALLAHRGAVVATTTCEAAATAPAAAGTGASS